MGNNPLGHPETLKPWTRSDGNNPPPKSPGAPRKRPISRAYDELVQSELPKEYRAALLKAGIKLKPNCTWADAIALSMARSALKANVFAAREMREGIEGKAPMRIEVLGEREQFQIVVCYEEGIEQREAREREVLARLEQRRVLPATTQNIIDVVTNDDEETKEE